MTAPTIVGGTVTVARGMVWVAIPVVGVRIAIIIVVVIIVVVRALLSPLAPIVYINVPNTDHVGSGAWIALITGMTVV